MTLPKTLAVVLNPASGLTNALPVNEATATSAQQRDKSANSNLKNVNSNVAVLNHKWKPTVN
ncbi:MAG: hypothetical protein LBD53_05730, partial [Tannerella sp.]|nr:hypothetical protein [Tannerella sp.]